MSEHHDEQVTRRGRPQGGFKSEAGQAAYWRMQYESAIYALADLIAENTENVEAVLPLIPGLRAEAERLRGTGITSVALWMESEADRLARHFRPGGVPDA